MEKKALDCTVRALACYCFLLWRRARMRFRMEETAKAPLASPASTNVGFSGESSQPPKPSGFCARTGSATIKARASATKKHLSFIATPMRSSATVYRKLESIVIGGILPQFDNCVLERHNSHEYWRNHTSPAGRSQRDSYTWRLIAGNVTELRSNQPAHVRPLSSVA